MPRHQPAVVLLSLSLLLGGATLAQSVEFAVTYPTSGGGNLTAEVVFADVPTEEGSAGLRLAAGDELGLGLRLRQADSLATIGNLVTNLAADGTTGGRYSAAFTARAVVGPAAVRLRASVHDGLPPLAPVAEGEFSELPLLGAGAAVLGLQAGVSYRVSRALIIDAAPGLYLRAGRLGASLAFDARLVRLHGRNDISLLFRSFARPGFEHSSLALGGSYTINRRRAPSWVAAAWLGLGPGGLAPGATLQGGERLEVGNLELLLAAEPYSVDAWPYRLDLDYERELGPGELTVGVQAGLQPQAGWQAGGRIGYRLPFEP